MNEPTDRSNTAADETGNAATGRPPDEAPEGLGTSEPTYQDLLDEALEETFPASDPISPAAAARAAQRTSSDKNPVDWRLEPGSSADASVGSRRDRAGEGASEADRHQP